MKLFILSWIALMPFVCQSQTYTMGHCKRNSTYVQRIIAPIAITLTGIITPQKETIILTHVPMGTEQKIILLMPIIIMVEEEPSTPDQEEDSIIITAREEKPRYLKDELNYNKLLTAGF